jgi:hypothetical protein
MRLGLDEEWCELKGCGLSHDALLSWEYRGPNKKNKEYIVSLKPSGCSGRDKSWNIIEGNVTRVSVVPTWATPIQHSQHCFPDITVAGSIEIFNWAFGTCSCHGICSAPLSDPEQRDSCRPGRHRGKKLGLFLAGLYHNLKALLILRITTASIMIYFVVGKYQ